MSDNSKKEDMTRIEDLSEFLHSEDSDIDDLFADEPPPFDLNTHNSDIDELEALEEDSSLLQTEEDDFTNSFEEQEESQFGDSSFTEEFQVSEEVEFPDIPTEDDSNDLNSPAEEIFNDTYEAQSDEMDIQDDTSTSFSNDISESIEASEDASIVPPEEYYNPAEEVEHTDEANLESLIPSTPRENFKEVVEFGNNITYGKVQSGGNPAFSVMLKGVDKEDVESILSTLNEHGLVGQNESIIRQSLDLGVLLIAQISEFSAIYLANKLKKYATDISIGLSEQIHKSKSYEKDNKGLVTKRSIFQNKDKKFIKELQKFNIEDMIVTKNGQIPSTQIINHIGVIATSKISPLSELTRQDLKYNNELENSKIEIHSHVIYDELIKDLCIIGHEKGANAILSVTYSMSALSEKDEDNEIQYQIICSGDAVVVDKI